MDKQTMSENRCRKSESVEDKVAEEINQQKKSKKSTPSTMPYDSVRTSCNTTRFIKNLPAVFNQENAEIFASTINISEIKEFGGNLASDLNMTQMNEKIIFKSIDNEASLILLMHALDFGGGWRRALHAYHGKGAWLTVKPGIEEMYICDPTLSADWLSTRTFQDVAKMFKLDIDYHNHNDDLKEKEIKRNAKNELIPFVSQLLQVINEVGNSLKKQNFMNIEEWLIYHLNKNHHFETPAGLLVHNLIESFPKTFNDKYTILNHEISSSIGDNGADDGDVQNQNHDEEEDKNGGYQIMLYKKAQLVVGEIYHRFRKDKHSKYNFKDGKKLTAFIDNVIVAVLRKLNIIQINDNELLDKIESHIELPSGSLEEVSLRAAALIGIEEIIKLVENRLTPVELGNYLWGYLGKTKEFRPYTRHATRDTVFY